MLFRSCNERRKQSVQYNAQNTCGIGRIGAVRHTEQRAYQQQRRTVNRAKRQRQKSPVRIHAVSQIKICFFHTPSQKRNGKKKQTARQDGSEPLRAANRFCITHAFSLRDSKKIIINVIRGYAPRRDDRPQTARNLGCVPRAVSLRSM